MNTQIDEGMSLDERADQWISIHKIPLQRRSLVRAAKLLTRIQFATVFRLGQQRQDPEDCSLITRIWEKLRDE